MKNYKKLRIITLISHLLMISFILLFIKLFISNPVIIIRIKTGYRLLNKSIAFSCF